MCQERGVDVDFDFIVNYQQSAFEVAEHKKEIEEELRAIEHQLKSIKQREGLVTKILIEFCEKKSS